MTTKSSMENLDPDKLLELCRQRCKGNRVTLTFPTMLHVIQEIRNLRAENTALLARVQGDERVIQKCLGTSASSTACDDQYRQEASNE